MTEKTKVRVRIIAIFGVLFLVILTLLLLIFNAGKKTYVVHFDLDGGTLLNGSLDQVVIHGQDATPPTVVKDGAFLRSWSGSYKQVTKNTVITAVWEYETTSGIIYTDSENQNYTEIEGSFEYLQGEVYLGAYHDDKKVLSILDGAFSRRTGITKVYLLDGLASIGNEAFSGCTGLTEIEIPKTVVRIGDGAFRDCSSLETLVLNEGIQEIGTNAFAGCTNLKTVILPESLLKIAVDAFAGCEDLVIKTTLSEDEVPDLWQPGWNGDAQVEWEFDIEEDAENTEDAVIADDSKKDNNSET